MSCYLGDYRATVGTCAGRFLRRDVLVRGYANGTTNDCLGLTVLISMILPVLLMIGGVEWNPRPILRKWRTPYDLYTDCGRNLNLRNPI